MAHPRADRASAGAATRWQSVLSWIGTLAVLAVTVGAGLVATPLRPAQAAAADCPASQILVNPCRPWFGGAAGSYPQVATGAKSQLLYAEQRSGRQWDFVHTFHAVGNNVLSADDIYFATRPDTFLFAAWKPADKWGTATGGNATVNAAIDQMATSIKSVSPNKVILSLNHEPENDATNAPSCPAGTAVGTAGTTDEYKAMWSNVESRFAALGVTNVVWAMTYISQEKFDCLAVDLWPGNSLVDWIFFDSYAVNTQTWDASTSRKYNLLTSHSDATHDFLSKPWGIGEFGATNMTAAASYAFYDDIKTSIDNNTYPRLKAYGVWDSKTNNDLRVGYTKSGVLDPVEQQHFNTVATDPLLLGAWSAPPDISPPTAGVTSPTSGATVFGPTTVTANVQDDTRVTGAVLLVDGVAAGPQVASPPASVSFSWDAASASEGSHTVAVQATDAAGNVGTSPAVPVTVTHTDPSPPSAPGQVTATATSPFTVDLTWQAASDNVAVASYVITRNGSDVATVGGATTAYSDSGLAEATSFTYSVRAVDAAGNVGAPALANAVATPDETAPTAVLGLAAVTSGPHQVDLTWSAASDNVAVAGYRVRRNGVTIATVGPAGLAFTDAAVTAPSENEYTIEAYDAAGNASVSDPVTPEGFIDGSAPTVPSDVLATATSATRIAVRWTPSTDNVGVTGYHVYRDGLLLTTVDGTASSYADTTVVDTGVNTYTYAIDAFDAAGNTSARGADVVASAADTEAPAVPSGLTATAGSSTSVDLRWTASTDNVGVVGYHIYRDGTAMATVSSGGATSYTDATVTESSTHTYTVDAFDDAGNTSAESGGASATTPDVTAPTVPTGVTATVLGATSVRVDWAASSDGVGVTGYHVYRNGVLLATVGAAFTYTDPTTVGSSTYSYTVDAVDAAGNTSARSVAASATTPDGTPPSVPTAVRAGTISYASIVVRWTASTDNVGVAKYTVFRDGVAVGSPTTTTFTDKGLVQGTSYTYTVTASDARGNTSAPSVPVVITAKADDQAPTVPPSVSSTVTLSYLVTTKWNASSDTGGSGLAGYRVFRSDNATTPIAIVGPTIRTYADTRVKAGTAYTYKVVAFDGRGNQSAAGSGSQVTTGIPKETVKPTTPASLRVVTRAATSISIAWNASTDSGGLKGYHVYRNGVYVADSTTPSFSDSGLTGATSYTYTVVAFDSSANVSATSAALVTSTT